MKRYTDCKHAFVSKKDALPKSGRGIGVEHASPDVIRESLKEAHLLDADHAEIFSKEDLIDAGLIGSPQSKDRRIALGEKLRIGYTNGKQLQKRLRMFNIQKEEFKKALMEIIQEEEHA